jgi:oligopeptidase A
MAYCPDRNLRYSAHLADVSRGSKSQDIYLSVNSQVKDIRQYRLDQAATIGYRTYADMSMDSKMAGTVENVQAMIGNLLGKAKQRQELELENLQSYAESRGFDEDMEVFDVEYFKRKQRRTLLG